MRIYHFTYNGVHHDVNIRWCSCCLTVTRRVSLVEQELLTLPEHLSLPRVYCEVRVTRSLVLCGVFCRSLFIVFRFSHCIVFPSSIDWFWLSLWYLQTLLPILNFVFISSNIPARSACEFTTDHPYFIAGFVPGLEIFWTNLS